VELLVAVILMTAGIAITISVFAASGRTTLGAQRSEVGVQKAQAEIEKLSRLEYGELALTALPPASTGPNDPNAKVTGSSFRVGPTLSEDLVLTASTGLTAKVDPGPESFSVGSGGAMVTGKVYRFVSWRDEKCPATICDGPQNTKRVTVAVALDPSGTQSARAPLWISSVVSDKDTTPPGSTAPPPTSPAVTAQSFYLYDTPCGQPDPLPQVGSHPTHDTASSGTTAAADSTCENADAAKQPDLMGPSLPAAPSDAPLYDYSSDLSGDRPGGLAMIHGGATCDTSYSEANAIGGPNKWGIHAWSTNPFASSFHLSRQVTLSLFTTTIGAATGNGAVCASLVDRQVANGEPLDRSLGSFFYELSSWPSSPRRLTFTFNLSQAEDVAAGHRLVLVLQARGESDNDLVFLYDHPLYPSLLEVSTSTPLTPQ
jgi:hypothetical protein